MADYTREEVVAKIAAGESLEGADLEGVDLREQTAVSLANLRYADLQEANLRRAKYNDDTNFYKGFDPKVAGMVFDK